MYPTPATSQYPGGNYGTPNMTDPAVANRTTGTMLNAEGQTVAISIPKVVNMEFNNLSRATDSFVLAVSFDGSKTPVALLARTDNAHRFRWMLAAPTQNLAQMVPTDILKSRVLTMAANLAEVKADANGTKMWQDRANNLVWIKVVGSLPVNTGWTQREAIDAPFGQDLFQTISLYMKDNTIPNQ